MQSAPRPAPETGNLILNGEYERVWQRHCGFLDLTLAEFMEIQWRLLEEQFAIARQSRLWQKIFGGVVDAITPGTFRQSVALTSYDLYEPLLREKPADLLGRPVTAWARTSGRGGTVKWVPYTPEAYLQLGEASLSDAILATARHRGDVRVRPNDVVVTNLPPRPYLSGLAQVATAEHIRFRLIPDLDEFEQLSYQERNARIFERAMVEGMDILGSMTLVLVKMGEIFETGANRRQTLSGEFLRSLLSPRLLWRGVRARLHARREGRDTILPRDLWQLKGLMCGGADTFQFRDRIRRYWGKEPHESYGCTEAGLLAMQAWDCRDMNFLPYTAFYEFIPQKAWQRERLQGTPPTETVLMDQVEAGERYEVVISSFYGGPFLRYRLHDLVEVTGYRNDALGIHLPQFRFVGRSGDFIDLAGFAGLIDEKQLLTAIGHTGLQYVDWTISKEIVEGEPLMHLYIELAPSEQASANEVAQRLHRTLQALNPEYANIEQMLGFVPMRATLLPPGAFAAYLQHQTAQGADMAHLKPMRIQPAPASLELLCTLQSSLAQDKTSIATPSG